MDQTDDRKIWQGLSFDGTNDYASAFGYKGITGGKALILLVEDNTAGRGIMYLSLSPVPVVCPYS